MGCIYKKRNVYWLKWYVRGRPMYESSRSSSKDEARRLLKLREGDAERGAPVSPKIGRVTFEEAAADLLNEYRTNGRRSLADVERRIRKHLTPFFERRRMADVTTADLREYIAQRQQEGASNATVNRELSALRRAYALAIQAGKLAARPHVPTLQEDNVRSGWFEDAQIEAVRALLPDYVRPVVTMAAITGWRTRSEVLPLRWKDVDFRAGTVSLPPGVAKNREARVFPFTTELRALLEAQRESVRAFEREHGRVIPFVFHRHGERIDGFRKAWATACKRAGLPGRIVHDFRRTAVRNLVRAGVPERVAMQLTGHKTRSVFERYNITSQGDLLEAAKKLDAARR